MPSSRASKSAAKVFLQPATAAVEYELTLAIAGRQAPCPRQPRLDRVVDHDKDAVVVRVELGDQARGLVIDAAAVADDADQAVVPGQWQQLPQGLVDDRRIAGLGVVGVQPVILLHDRTENAASPGYGCAAVGW